MFVADEYKMAERTVKALETIVEVLQIICVTLIIMTLAIAL